MKWHEGPMVAMDTETTSVDPTTASIVTAAVVHHTPGARPSTIQWVIDPGVDIPAEAANVHGWTTERLADYLQGQEAVKVVGGVRRSLTRTGALSEIAAQAATAIHAEAPLVVVNAAYDLTLLEHELGRHNLDTLTERVNEIRGVVDPQVIEKAFDPYRKLCYRAPGCRPQEQHHECSGCRGGRRYACGGCGAHTKQLGDLCSHYGLVHGGAHDAAGDALAGIRLARRLAGLWPDIARLKLSTLHGKQVEWRAEQANSLRAYFDKNGIEHDGVDPAWPLHSSLLGRAA